MMVGLTNKIKKASSKTRVVVKVTPHNCNISYSRFCGVIQSKYGISDEQTWNNAEETRHRHNILFDTRLI